jgi:hypothetical protein
MKIIIIMLLLTICGCSNVDSNNISNTTTNIQQNISNTKKDVDCVNLVSCQLIKNYTNALGEECKSLISANSQTETYCLNKSSLVWVKIKTL